jgi:biotin transporter BioY
MQIIFTADGTTYYQLPHEYVIALGITLLVLYAIYITVFAILCCIEANSQFKSGVLWFILGLFFGVSPFVALKLGKNAFEKKHSEKVWMTLGFFFTFLAIIAFECGVNAERSGRDFDSWVLLGMFLGLLVLLISCLFKPQQVIAESNSAPVAEKKVEKKQISAGELIKFKALLDAGIITEEEYNAKIKN